MAAEARFACARLGPAVAAALARGRDAWARSSQPQGATTRHTPVTGRVRPRVFAHPRTSLVQLSSETTVFSSNGSLARQLQAKASQHEKKRSVFKCLERHSLVRSTEPNGRVARRRWGGVHGSNDHPRPARPPSRGKSDAGASTQSGDHQPSHHVPSPSVCPHPSSAHAPVLSWHARRSSERATRPAACPCTIKSTARTSNPAR